MGSASRADAGPGGVQLFFAAIETAYPLVEGIAHVDADVLIAPELTYGAVLMLGNGYCARPVELDCHFESICESCTYFVTTNQFRPTLQAQREDAAAKGQIGRLKVFDRLLARLDAEPSTAPEHEAS